MPTAAVPFLNALQSGDEELAGASPVALNVVIDGATAVRRRPALRALSIDTFDSTPTGLYAAEDGTVFGAFPRASGGGGYAADLWRISEAGNNLVGSFIGERRPVFAETEMLLVIAAGQRVYKVELADPTSISLLGGSPPQASHIVHNSLRLIGNDLAVDRTKIRYSSEAAGTTTYAGHEQWLVGNGTAGFFTAEAATDPVVALGENTNELWAFGSRTLQLFVRDRIDVFTPSTTLEVGCAAPYSVVKREGQFYWLDHARRFVKSNGRGTEVLSQGLQQVIQGFGTVSDCFGYRVIQGPVDGVVFKFPTEGRTFFVQEGAGWSEWSSWSTATNQHVPFGGACHAFDRLTGSNYVGVPIHGVAKLQMGVATDFDDPLVAEVTTGFLNRGTDARKYCRSLRLTFRRGSASRRPEIRGYIRYRDSVGPWEPPIAVVLDGMQPVCEINSLGTYRRRQWKYTFSDEVEDLVLAGAEEDFVVTD